MSEIPALLRELIEEIQGLRSDLSEVRGPMGHTLGDIHAQLIDTEKAVIEIGGTYGSTLSDVTDRLGSASIYNLEDLFVQLTALTSAVEDLKE